MRVDATKKPYNCGTKEVSQKEKQALYYYI